MVIKNAKYGKFVTTAKDFSKCAREGVKEVLKHGFVEEFDLINYDSLKQIINRSTKETEDPWEIAIRHPFDSDIKSIWRKED